jgi:mono/diheme cytochrome c family protein
MNNRAITIVGVLAIAAAVSVTQSIRAQTQSAQTLSPEQALLNRYCITCHNDKTKTAGLMLDKLDFTNPGKDAESWEKAARKVRAGMMPPGGAPRPDRATLDAFADKLEVELDRAAAANPNPGFTGLHRLNRTEYANAVRDLLALDIDAATLLPADDSSEGFDNIADALGVSPALVERYAAAATKVSRMAVGNMLTNAFTTTYRVPGDLSQTEHIDGLPLGTRGGILVHHNFPLDAEYDIKVRARSGGIGVGGIGVSGEELEVTVNGERVKVAGGTNVDVHVKLKAGPQTVGAAYLRRSPPGADDLWQIYAASNVVSSIAITGPLNPTGLGDTPARRRIFVCRPASEELARTTERPYQARSAEASRVPDRLEGRAGPVQALEAGLAKEAEDDACAKKIVSTLAQRAYRQPPSTLDQDTLLSFYREGRKNGGFDAGIEQAVSRILADPRFVFRFEREPANLPAGRPYRISDLELASRLSFFVWSSIPDDELLGLAIENKLHDPAVLEAQTRRMLKDPRSETLVTDFGDQWLYLRELKNQRPEAKEFNDNLRQSFRRETELLLDSILREDRSVIDLLNADYTFVDEALAKHYGIPDVRGTRFRRVAIQDENRRGLLGQSSFLLVTSVANRTSPVARGKWVLENLLGTPAPLPPPNVPPLDTDASAQQAASVRQRMEEHRKNPTCAACHKIMDPIGFSLENFDLIGRYRASDGGTPIDASGQLVDGTKLDGPASLRLALLSRSGVFVQTMTEKLLTYGAGRALRYYDMPVVRSIVREAARNDNRFSALIVGIVKSDPFQMRVKQQEATQ